MKRRGTEDKIHEGLGEALPIHITKHQITVLCVAGAQCILCGSERLSHKLLSETAYASYTNSHKAKSV